jgi:hypothetical protein
MNTFVLTDASSYVDVNQLYCACPPGVAYRAYSGSFTDGTSGMSIARSFPHSQAHFYNYVLQLRNRDIDATSMPVLIHADLPSSVADDTLCRLDFLTANCEM